MRHLTPAQYRVMPWRNGGGTTTEILVEPEGSGLGASDHFLHRVSVADVASDGPFSRFEGYDRHIVLIEGAGMTLDCGEHGRVDLAPLEPRSFPGEWDVRGELVRGPVRDFNLIVDRARASSSLEVRVLDAPATLTPGDGGVCVVHVLEGSLDGVARHDTIVIDAPAQIVPSGVARVAIARVTRRAR